MIEAALEEARSVAGWGRKVWTLILQYKSAGYDLNPKCCMDLSIRLSDLTTKLKRARMHLTDHDLRQLDRDALSRRREEAARRLLERVVEDLKEARDWPHQDSQQSSRPPVSNCPGVMQREGWRR